MRIVRNERRIEVFSSVGQYATLGGLLILLGGLVVSFIRPTWLWPVMGSMMLGFALSVVGGYFASRYTGPLAHHEALAEMLKGLDYRHTLIQYLLPADHVLLEPGGCTVFVVKPQGGEVRYQSEGRGRWKHRQRGKFFRELVGQPSLGRPDQQAHREADRLQDYLKERLEEADRVPVRPAILFVNEDVELDAGQSPVPALYRKKVKDWLRGPGELRPLPAELQRALGEALDVEDELEEVQ